MTASSSATSTTTKKQSIHKIASILAVFGVPVTPELIRRCATIAPNATNSSGGENLQKINYLMEKCLFSLLILDANQLWYLENIKERMSRLLASVATTARKDSAATENSQCLLVNSKFHQYIDLKLSQLGYVGQRPSTPRQKLLCLSWLMVRLDVVGCYVKRMEKMHSRKMRLPEWDYDWDFSGINGEEGNNTSSSTTESQIPPPSMDFSKMNLTTMCKVLIAYIRKIYLKGRFLLGHCKSMATLHDEIQKKLYIGAPPQKGVNASAASGNASDSITSPPLQHNAMIYKTTPYEMSLCLLKEHADELQNHVQTLRFLSDVYTSVARYFQWIEGLVTEEKLQTSGLVPTHDLNLRSLKKSLKNLNEDTFYSLLQSVKELHEELLIENEEQFNSATEDKQPAANKQWWTQLEHYERYMRELDMERRYRQQHDQQSDAPSSTGAPFSPSVPHEKPVIVLQKNRNIESGVSKEIQRLESILQRVEHRLENLRTKHEGYLEGISKATMYDPV